MTSKDQATVAVVLKNVKKNNRNLKLPSISLHFMILPKTSF